MATDTQHEDGKVTEEDLAAARRRIGIEMPHARPGQEYATIDSIKHYAEGLGDVNPLFQDVENARKTRWGKMIAHPTMMLIMGVSEKKELTHEERERGRGGGLAGVHGFYSGDDIEWFRPICEGDRLIVKGGLARIDEHKSAFSGTTYHFTSDEVYRNQNGELVGIARHMSIRAERSQIRGKGKYSDLKTQSYTPEEMAKIDADYEREYIRGEEPRYWEDVQVGEETVPVVKGPYTATAYICFAEGTG
ncbi:MAG: MaoC family dehydratase, partial [Chloroflexota bacterium]